MNKKILKLEHIYGIILIIFLYFLFLYPQDFGTVIIGSISSDHLIQTQKYIIDFFSNFNYPYIYNLGHGFDLFASSIHSGMHPLYFFINIFLSEKVLLKEIFVKIHMFLFIMGMFIYLKNKVINKTILTLLVVVVSNSIVMTSNIPHPFLICVYSYFPLLLILIEKIIKKQKFKYFFSLSLVIFLMLMVGHFQHQFIFLTFLMIFLIANIFQEKISISIFFKICFFISISFILSLPQLLPTFDLMLIGERSSTGSISRFDQSLNGFGIIGYFFPGINFTFYKHFDDYYQLFTTSPSLVEGSHYLGIFSISLFFFLIKKIGYKLKEDPIIISIIFLILRGLGIYFIINLFLNYFPIFGQFRAPVRNLYLVDLLIIVFIGINFKKYFHLEEYKNFFKKFLKYYTGLLLLIILFSLLLINNFVSNIEFHDYFVILFSLFIALLLFFVLKFFKNKNLIFALFLILTIVDLFFYKFATPLHSKIQNKDNFIENIKSYENLCKKNQTNSIITLFDHSEIDNDLPRFRYGNKTGKNFILSKNDKNNKLLGVDKYLYTYDCNISMGVRQFTMASNGATKIHDFVYLGSNEKKLNTHDKIYLLSLLGYTHFLNLENNKLKVVNKEIISDYDKSIINEQVITNFFEKKIEKNLLFKNFDLFFYEKLNKSLLKNLLTTFETDVNVIKNIRFIGFGGTRNIIIKDADDKIIKHEIYDPFIKVFTDKKTLTVTHVPTPFLIGIILIIPLIVILSLIFTLTKIKVTRFFSLTKKYFFSKFLQKNSPTSGRKIIKLINIISAMSILIIILCTIYLIFFGLEKIQIGEKTMPTLSLSLLFVIYFVFSFLFLFKILDVNIMNKKVLKVLYFVICNILIGTVLVGELIVYNTPEILIDKFNLQDDYFDGLKNFLIKYIW